MAILENKTSVKTECIDHLDLDSVAKATEGHVARDLCSVVERAVHAHRMVSPSDNGQFYQHHTVSTLTA